MRRREVLEGAAVGLVLGLGGRRAWAAGPARHGTPECELGPFYKRAAPDRPRLRGDKDGGLPLLLAGTIYNTRGDLVPDATIELWHADAAGHYDIEGDHFRAALRVDPKAMYSVDTVMPGHYPGRVCQHVHYLVRAPGHRPLITQLFFATDPVFGGEPAKNLGKDPLIASAELVRPVTLSGDGARTVANVTFDLVLERA